MLFSDSNYNILTYLNKGVCLEYICTSRITSTEYKNMYSISSLNFSTTTKRYLSYFVAYYFCKNNYNIEKYISNAKYFLQQFNNKIIAQLASDIFFMLCDLAQLLWTRYPRLSHDIITTLCQALFLHAPLGTTAGESDRSLGTALLLCLGEWCMRLGPARLTETPSYGEQGNRSLLLLQVFTVS